MKVLLISHNPFSTYQSMGKTFMSLFSSFEKEELCQLYVYPSFSDVDMANSYYRLTDRDAIKRICPLLRAGGEVTHHAYTGSMVENSTDKKIYSKESNNQPLMRILRDLVWKMSFWYTRDLRDWLDREKPTCIFLAPGYAKFIYDIAMKISRERGLPIVIYICDDYYFLEEPKSPVGALQLKLLQRKTRQTMDASRLLVAISKPIADVYGKAFSIDSEIIMTGAGFEVAKEVPERLCVENLSYFGNIGLNRDKSLVDIGRALDEINAENGTSYGLKIHTDKKNPLVDATFAGIRSICVSDFLVGDAYKQAFYSADCLVHVEGFDAESMDLVKSSISTKIADSLASGIPLLAYGPAGIASMDHVEDNECAFVAHDYEGLKATLNVFFRNPEERKRIAENARNTAKQHHVSATNSLRLKETIQKVEN